MGGVNLLFHTSFFGQLNDVHPHFDLPTVESTP